MTSIDPLLLLDNTSMMSVMNKGVFRCTDVTFEEAKAIMEVHKQEDILAVLLKPRLGGCNL